MPKKEAVKNIDLIFSGLQPIGAPNDDKYLLYLYFKKKKETHPCDPL